MGGESHVPYKNHKLTQLMQDALGGTSKTLMFVNCSPASSNLEESQMSLKYATRAKLIVNDTQAFRKSLRSKGSLLSLSQVSPQVFEEQGRYSEPELPSLV